MREERIKIFDNTKELVANKRLNANIVHYKTYSHMIHSVEADLQEVDYDNNRIVFEKLDTISASIKYKSYSGVDFLVFASSKHYGGGVETGAKAQEEDIFLCTDLSTLTSYVNRYYPLQGILTVDCHIVKDHNYLPLDKPIEARAIFAAAPNLNKEMRDPKLEVSFYQRMCNLTNITYNFACGDTLILGAWGCGVFKNDPVEVAKMFKKIMPLLLTDYKKVVMAIPDEHILNIFKSVFDE